MNKRDFYFISSIGALVGLLAQPVLHTVVANVLHRPADFLTSVLVWLVFFIGAPVALYICSFLNRFVSVAYQFGKFAATGVLNTFVDLGIFNVLASPILSKGLILTDGQFTGFKTISFIAATANSYFWNSRWTFSNGARSAGNPLSFYIVSFVGFLVNVAVAYSANILLLKIHFASGIAANLSVMCAVIASLIFNFVGYKYFVFQKNK